MRIINKMFDKIGFHYVGYKIYIDCIMSDIKTIKKDVKINKLYIMEVEKLINNVIELEQNKIDN